MARVMAAGNTGVFTMRNTRASHFGSRLSRHAVIAWLGISFASVAMEAVAQSRGPIELDAPLICPERVNCMIQQFVDVDPGKGARDFTCGSATYNGHKGTDFRVLRLTDIERGIRVVASAPGRVIGVRNSVPDRLMRTAADRATVKGGECGNGVRIDHGNGWVTQYCHLRKDSVVVKRDDWVERGQKLGFVGYSGAAAFAHVHLSVEKNGNVIDPFTGLKTNNACGVEEVRSLWSGKFSETYAYRAGQIVDTGFADRVPKRVDIAKGRYDKERPGTKSPALVGWGWAINLRAGDQISVALSLPSGRIMAEHDEIMNRNKAEYLISVGKRLKATQWPTGAYRVTVRIIRDNRKLDERIGRIVFR